MSTFNRLVFLCFWVCSFNQATNFKACEVMFVLANKVERGYTYSLNKLSTTADMLIDSPLFPERKEILTSEIAASVFFFPDMPLNGHVNMQFMLMQDNGSITPVDVSMELKECHVSTISTKSPGFYTASKQITEQLSKNPFAISTSVRIFIEEKS